MLGGKNKQPLGYTIVEVMVVLAVSSVMFLIAAQFINGKQQKTAFTAGVNEMASQIQDVIEQVTDGSYSDIKLTCTFDVTTNHTTVGAGIGTQGTQHYCVFLGKMMQFSVGGPSGSSHTYDVISFAGGRIDSTGNPIVNLTGVNNADPSAINPLTTTLSTPQALDVTGSVVTDPVTGTQHPSFAIGFFQGQGTIAGGKLQSGGQTIAMYYMNALGAGSAPLAGSVAGGLLPAQTADICMTDGTRKADIRLGGANGGQLSADVIMGATAICTT